MELKEQLDRQVTGAARDVVIRLSKGEVPDAASLALALASGETAQTLADKARERIERKTAKPEAEANPVPAVPTEPAAAPVPPSHPTRSHPKK